MEQQCRICQILYDEASHLPIKICSNRHFCCQACFAQIFQKGDASLISRCPYCREAIQSYTVALIKQQALKALELKRLQRATHRQIDHANTSLNRKQRNSLIWRTCRKAKKTYGFEYACQFLQKQVQLYSEVDTQFIGLGSQSKSFGDYCSYEWYEKHYRVAELCLYDQLAVILILEKAEKMNVDWYESILKKDSSNYRALFGLAMLYHNKGDFKTALQMYQKIIELRSNFDKPYALMALIYLEENRKKLAYKFATKCFAVNPDNIFCQLIFVLSSDRLTSQEILQRLQEIIKKQPKLIQALNLYGQQLSKIGQYKRANESYLKCAQLTPRKIPFLIKRAKNMIAQKQYSQIISQLKEISNFANLPKSQNDDINYLLGIAYDYFEMKSQSIQHYLKVDQRLHQDLPLKKAEAYFQLGEWKLALDDYKKSYENGSSDLSIIIKIVTCYRKLNETKEKTEWLQKWHDLQPEDKEIIFQLGASNQSCQNNDKSLVFYKKCLEKGQKLHEAYPKVIEILRMQNQCQQSFRYAKEFRRKCNLSQRQKNDLLKQDRLNEIRQRNLKKKGQSRIF